MNSNVTRALFRDATAQVIDNKIFRILLVLLCVILLPVLLIAARENEVVICFFWHFSYADLASLVHSNLTPTDHPNRQLIQTAEKILTDYLASGMGTLFGITATSFFMPRMLEKGAADVVFSKPVSRFALLMSRYVAGLIFAGSLAVLMIGGMHFGLLLNSGYSDPGFLWSIPILIYVFGIVHAVSLLVGVITRSSVAAILITLVFYSFNGCVHVAWIGVEMVRPAGPLVGELADEEAPDAAEEAKGMWQWLGMSLDIVHFALPKTTEADIIAHRVRRAIQFERMEFVDTETNLVVPVAPPGFTRDATSSLDTNGVRWLIAGSTDEPVARVTLKKRTLAAGENRFQVAKKYASDLESKGSATSDLISRKDQLDEHFDSIVEWTERNGDAQRKRRTEIFQEGAALYELEFDADVAWATAPDHAETFTMFRNRIHFGADFETSNNMQMSRSSSTPIWGSSFEKRYGWTAPWRYNFFFSIGSTLAFIAIVLGLAQWKLSRIDF